MISSSKKEEFIIFCDESEKEGPKFSNFYGGAIINLKNFEKVQQKLKQKISDLNLNEIKRQKVSLRYLEKYEDILNCFFDIVEEGIIKVRIIFSQTAKLEQTKENKRYRYSKFYYLFIKYAFGLSYLPCTGNVLRLYFDQLPTNKPDTLDFKRHIKNLQYTKNLKGKIKISSENIVDVDSKMHPIIQCVDLIVGVIEYYANYFNSKKPLSNRGIAKIELYNLINSRIKDINPEFFMHLDNLKFSTPKECWTQKFLQTEFILKQKK